MIFKRLFVILILLLCGSTLAIAKAPLASVSLNAFENTQWPAQYRLTLTIPEHHHAYLDSGEGNIYLPVVFDPKQALMNQGVKVQELQKPEGVFDDVVKATVLRGMGEFILTLMPSNERPSISTLPLEIRYQLCNEQTNVCFRPKQITVELPLPDLQANINEGTSSESKSLMAQLLTLFEDNRNNTLILFGLMFLAGLLSVATPCVYPMLPITSLFIVNRANGDARKEKQHALVYLIGMVGTYMLLGLVAGMTGGAFNSLMQSAFVNLAFAIFFAFFALSLLGFYELSFMQNEVHTLDQKSSQVAGLTGTWLMGSVAGLVISPCVGPIVFALLLQVADNIAAQADALAAMQQTFGFWDKLAIAGQGGLIMSGFGLGVGLPFFGVGVIKFRKLPKAGYWMNKIKYAFGLVILYFAYTYLHKGLGVLGVEDDTVGLFAVAMVALWFAVVHCNVLSTVPVNASPNEKLHRYCGVISLLIGGWLFVVSMEQMPIIKTAEAVSTPVIHPAATAQVNAVSEGGIVWHRDFAEAQKTAQATGKPIFIDFYASWCANCVAFKEETEHNPMLNRVLREDAIALKLVDGEAEFERFRKDAEHRQLKIGLPYFAILTPEGTLAWSGTDYQATNTMIKEIIHLSHPLS